MIKNKQISAMAMGLFGNMIFGFSFLFSKLAFGIEEVKVTPFILLAYRFLLAFLLMNLLILCRAGHISLRGRPWWKLLGLGLLQPVLYFIFENYALQTADTVLSSVMLALIPIAALLFGIIFMKEFPTLLQWFFAFLSVGGVVVISVLRSQAGQTPFFVILLLIGAMLSAAFFNLVSRKTASEFTPFERTYMMFALSAVVFLLLAVVENRADLGQLIRPVLVPEFDAAVVFLGIFSSVFAFFAVNYANTYLTLTRSTVFSNITTVVSVLVGIWLLKEEWNVGILLSVFAIVVGVIGVQLFQRKE